MVRLHIVNPAHTQFGSSFITPRWAFVIAQATPLELVDEITLVDETIEKFNPDSVEPGDLVAIGITTGNCIAGYKVLERAKGRGATVVMGGTHVTLAVDMARRFRQEAPEPILKGADAIVTGNGDVIWATVVRDFADNRLRPIYEGGTVRGSMLKPAKWDLMKRGKYMFPSVQTVAGCPENCSFCSVWTMDGRDPRLRDDDAIIDEVLQLHNMGYRFIIFADDNFNPATLGRIEREESDSKRAELRRIREQRLAFFEKYDRRVPKDVFAFTQMTSEVVSDEEYLKAMYGKMRIRAALVGVESFTREGLESANKTWNPTGEKMADTIRIIQENGILVLSSIICGLESDDAVTLKTMGDFALTSGTFLAQFTVYSPMLGTTDWYYMMSDLKNRTSKKKVAITKDGYWLDENKPALLITHPNLTADTLLNAVLENWSKFYSWRNCWRRAQATGWPLKSRLAYVLGSKAFRAVYGGYGLEADSVKSKRLAFAPRLMLRAGVSVFNHFFLKPPAPFERSAQRREPLELASRRGQPLSGPSE